MERQIGTNFQSQMHSEDEQEEEQDGDDNISIASSDAYNNSGSLKMPLAVKQSDPNISKVNGQNTYYKTKKESCLNQMYMLIFKKSLIQRKMMINFTVICLQPTCRDYRAQVNYVLSMKLTIYHV